MADARSYMYISLRVVPPFLEEEEDPEATV
jgi:hypothetical protein